MQYLIECALKGRLKQAYIISSEGTGTHSKAVISIVEEFIANYILNIDGYLASLRLNHVDYLLIQGSNRSILIDQVRSVISFFSKTSIVSAKRICVISNADEMTDEATAALLKTLEELPKGGYLFLIANPRRLPDTIVSRCEIAGVSHEYISKLDKLEHKQIDDIKNVLALLNGSVLQRQSCLLSLTRESLDIFFSAVLDALHDMLRHALGASVNGAEYISAIKDNIRLFSDVNELYKSTEHLDQLYVNWIKYDLDIISTALVLMHAVSPISNNRI